MNDQIRSVLSQLSFLPDAYAVGGCVRDALLGHEPEDVDVATSAAPEEVMRSCENHSLHASPTGLDHGTVTVRLGGDDPHRHVEVTTFRRDVSTDGRRATVEFARAIEEDLARRDFTMNAMAWNEDRGIVDPFGGWSHLQRRYLQTVGDPDTRFREDYLRVVRAARFAARFGLRYHADTREAMAEHGPYVLEHVSIERVTDEFDKAWRQCPSPSRFLIDLDQAGVLARYLPEITELQGLTQHPGYHPLPRNRNVRTLPRT